jgi:1,4-dihydroxy-2-naphthoate octaprenyltransferase
MHIFLKRKTDWFRQADRQTLTTFFAPILTGITLSFRKGDNFRLLTTEFFLAKLRSTAFFSNSPRYSSSQESNLSERLLRRSLKN